jgi:hypothetical protein
MAHDSRQLLGIGSELVVAVEWRFRALDSGNTHEIRSRPSVRVDPAQSSIKKIRRVASILPARGTHTNPHLAAA